MATLKAEAFIVSASGPVPGLSVVPPPPLGLHTRTVEPAGLRFRIGTADNRESVPPRERCCVVAQIVHLGASDHR